MRRSVTTSRRCQPLAVENPRLGREEGGNARSQHQGAPRVLPGDPVGQPPRRGPFEPRARLFGNDEVDSREQDHIRPAPPRVAVEAQPEAEPGDGGLALPTQPFHGKSGLWPLA